MRFGITKQLFFGAALAAATLSACADETIDTEISEEEIIGGFPARSKKLDAVGALGVSNGDGTFFPFCSATLVTPTVVLTAEHCVNFWGDASQVSFLVGWDARNPKAAYPARGFAWEQTVFGGAIGLGSDVAVVHLATPVTDVTPMPFAAIDEADLGRRFTGIGYGQQDALGSSGTRLAGSMTFNAIGGALFEHIYGSFDAFVEEGRGVFFPEDFDTSIPENLALLQQAYDENLLLDVEAFFGNGHGDAQACFGDSGGPITALLAGKTTVFGVASWVPFADALCQYGATYATLNDISLDFLDYEINCPLIPAWGTCDGTTAVRCATQDEGGYRELRTDCAELGQECGFDPEFGEIACIDPAGCDHEVCEEGTRLAAECGECQTDICAVDPYCCEVAWDAICVAEVETVCGEACPAAPAPDADALAIRARFE